MISNKTNNATNDATSARRKNNIYGETTDYVVMKLISMGCDGVIYNPKLDPVNMIGRTQTSLYLIHIIKANQADVVPDASPASLKSVSAAAEMLSAKPIILIARDNSRTAKCFHMDGDKLGKKLASFA